MTVTFDFNKIIQRKATSLPKLNRMLYSNDFCYSLTVTFTLNAE